MSSMYEDFWGHPVFSLVKTISHTYITGVILFFSEYQDPFRNSAIVRLYAPICGKPSTQTSA